MNNEEWQQFIREQVFEATAVAVAPWALLLGLLLIATIVFTKAVTLAQINKIRGKDTVEKEIHYIKETAPFHESSGGA